MLIWLAIADELTVLHLSIIKYVYYKYISIKMRIYYIVYLFFCLKLSAGKIILEKLFISTYNTHAFFIFLF